MKKSTNVILVVVILALMSGCAERKEVTTNDGDKSVTRTYVPYGLFDENKKNPNIEYEVSIGNVIWGVLLFETVIAPIIIFGWYLYEPISPKVTDPNLVGTVS